MTLPADWITGDDFTATDENNVETAINNLVNGATVPPRYVNISNAASLTLTVAKNVYVFNGTTATWTLPAVSAGSYNLALYNRGTGTLTVQRAGANQIYRQGVLVNSFTLSAGQSAQLVSDGTYWLMQAGASRIPAHDNTTLKPYANYIKGVNFTHTVNTGGCYGVVLLAANGIDGLNENSPVTAKTFGGVTLTEITNGSLGSWCFYRLFGAFGIPAGNPTVNLQLLDGTKTFNGCAIASTFSNVTTQGSLSFHEQQGTTEWFYVSVTPDTANPSIYFCFMMMEAGPFNPATMIPLSFTFKVRNSASNQEPSVIAGYLTTAQTESFVVSGKGDNAYLVGPFPGNVGALCLY